MPVFDYECGSCGKEFEELVSSPITPDSEIKCPYCGEDRAKRKMSAPANRRQDFI